MDEVFSQETFMTLKDLGPTILGCVIVLIIGALAIKLNVQVKTSDNYSEVIANLRDQQFVDLQRVKYYRDLLSTKEREYKKLQDEYKVLNDKYTRRNQPRRGGRFASKKKAVVNPDLGKYLCLNMNGFFNPTFTAGKSYERYESSDMPAGHLILIGDDLQRHDVVTHPERFELIS